MLTTRTSIVSSVNSFNASNGACSKLSYMLYSKSVEVSLEGRLTLNKQISARPRSVELLRCDI